MVDIAFAPYTGKGTGERALLRTMLTRLTGTGWLFLMDAGLPAFDISCGPSDSGTTTSSSKSPPRSNASRPSVYPTGVGWPS